MVERGISYTNAKKQMDIFNSVKTTYAQAAATKIDLKWGLFDTFWLSSQNWLDRFFNNFA